MAFHIHVLLSTTLHQIHITKFKNVFRKSGFISVKLVLGRIIHAKPHHVGTEHQKKNLQKLKILNEGGEGPLVVIFNQLSYFF